MVKPTVKTALIDADIVVFQAAVVSVVTFDWDGDGSGEPQLDWPAAKRNIRTVVNKIVRATGCDDYRMCFTNKRNFRYTVLPTYKYNRVNNTPPAMLSELRKWTKSTMTCASREWLEADDLIGILASRWPDMYVACSIDKDFESIPCTLFNWRHDKKPRRISQEEADYKFHFQWMTGDTTDGYHGVYRCGKKCAEKILAENPPESWTDAVIELYASKCYSWKAILQQAQMARILRHTDYNWETGEVILWTP